nr:hypothetical protein [Nitrosomonas nitrosa]
MKKGRFFPAADSEGAISGLVDAGYEIMGVTKTRDGRRLILQRQRNVYSCFAQFHSVPADDLVRRREKTPPGVGACWRLTSWRRNAGR